jgi:hypothetical protein
MEEVREDKKWIMVKNFPSRLFAEQAREILETNGISVIIKGEDIGILGPGAGYGTTLPHGISLWVPEENYEEAKSLIETFLGNT